MDQRVELKFRHLARRFNEVAVSVPALAEAKAGKFEVVGRIRDASVGLATLAKAIYECLIARIATANAVGTELKGVAGLREGNTTARLGVDGFGEIGPGDVDLKRE